MAPACLLQRFRKAPKTAPRRSMPLISRSTILSPILVSFHSRPFLAARVGASRERFSKGAGFSEFWNLLSV